MTMEKTVQANAVITLNMEPARDNVNEFKEAIKKATQELDELNKKPVNLRTEAEKKRIRELEKEIPKLNDQLAKAESNLKNFRDTLLHLDKASINDLTNAKRALNDQIRRLTPGTKEYIAATSDFKKVNDRLASLNAAYKQVSAEQKGFIGSIKGLFGWFNKYWGGLTMLSSALTGLSMKVRQCAEDVAKLDDVYADVMKTTGLLHNEVADLDKELMKIDTRTSREQLLLLARDAGKLGISGKKDILGFVRAADQIQVALGEDLGEGAIKNLGKIADVFGLTKEMGIEKSMLSIASAVNALGQASTASEAYLVDFTQRLAGVGAMAGLSVQDILGFASGLDQSAMKVEMAATAFQKFLMKMYEEPAKFAKYAGMEVEAFTELLKTNANEAITTVMKAMNGQDGFAAMVPIFNEMGLDGARAVSVLASMTQNLEAVTEAQRLANVEFAKGTSVTEEYTTKNNNLQAQLEKARKEFHNASIALGQSLNPIMLKSTKATTYLIRALAQYGKEIKTVIIVIAVLTAALKAKNAAVAIGNAAMKVANALQATGKVITLALSVAYNTLANNTTRAAAAQKMLNAAMSSSVFGVILTAVTGLTVGIMALTKHIKEARKEREWLSNLEKDASVEYAKQASEMTSLSKIVHNNNISLEERKRALEELKKIVPDYHADLTEEGRLIRDNTAALDDYLDNLKKTVRMEIFKESYRELQKQMIEQEKLLEDAKQRQAEALKNAGGNTQTEYYVTEYGELGGGRTTKHKTQYGEATDMVEEAEKGLKKLQSKEKEIEQQIGVVSGKVLNAMDEDIAAVNKKYNELFNEIQEQYRDNPAAGNEARQNLEKQKKDEIATIRQKHAEQRTVETEETTTTNAILTQTQFEYLQERQDKLTKKEQEMVKAGYAALSAEDSKALKARYDKLMAADNNAADKRYQAELKAIQQNERAKQNDINRAFFDKEITAQKHEEELVNLKANSLNAQLDLAKKYGQDTSVIEQQLLTAEQTRRKFYYDQALKMSEQRRMEEEISLREQLSAQEITQEEYDARMLENREKYLRQQQELALRYKQDGSGIQLKDIEARQKEEENALRRHLTNQEITQEEFDKRMLEVRVKYLQQRLELAQLYGQDETDILQAFLDAQMEADRLAIDQMAKLKEEAAKVKAGLRSPSELRDDEEDADLKKLDELHDAMLLSEEEYEEAVKQLREKYADEDLQEKLANVQKYAEKVNTIMSEASNFVAQLKEHETQKLEAEYQAQLTAAGDNAEQREAIEAEYEQKKLDIQKKYADTEMVINIAKTIAAGALAAIQAFAQLGPIGGAVAAVLIAATTALEVATIVQQRNAIKNASVGSSGSSAPKTGTRTVTGYSGGGYTMTSADDDEEAGVVHANEWVAPAWMVRRKPAVFANLEKYRKQGSHGQSGHAADGFADGGFTGGVYETRGGSRPKKDRRMDDDIDTIVRVAVREELPATLKTLRVVLVRRDLDELDAQDKRLKKLTSRS